MTVADLRAAVCGFMRRKSDDFKVGDFDICLRAMNNARLYAERLIDFELARQQVVVPRVSITDGGSLDTAYLYGGDPVADVVRVKKIKKVFLAYSFGDGTYPVPFIGRDAYVNRVRMRYDKTDLEDPVDVTDLPVVVSQMGRTIFVSPALKCDGGTVDIYLDAICWLDDYTSTDEDQQTDFLLDYCFDWLMYRSIFELNFFLKEDERVALSSELVADAWNAVIRWNGNLISQEVEDVSLD